MKQNNENLEQITSHKNKKKSILLIFITSFRNPWIIILCGVLLIRISMVIIGFLIPKLSISNNLVDICSIFIAIIVLCGFNTFCEYKK